VTSTVAWAIGVSMVADPLAEPESLSTPTLACASASGPLAATVVFAPAGVTSAPADALADGVDTLV
jgi:hypothetical protein